MFKRALSWDSLSLGRLRRAPLCNVHVGISQEGQRKREAEVPKREWRLSLLLLVNSAREALPRDQLPLGALAVRSSLNPARWLVRQPPLPYLVGP